MLAPPSLKNVLLYPVTAGLALAALIVTGMWWSGQSIDWAVMDFRVWSNWELWRALTCTLPHVNFFHLAFNLYWLWTFGTLVERVYGHWKCALIYLLFAFGSSLGEFTVFSGGVGLSGVGYGLWGLLWVLEKRDARFADAVDQQTSLMFVFWFFLCVLLTLVDVMPVANVAHAVGAGMGALLGLIVGARGAVKRKSFSGLVALVILGLLGSTVLWPWTNQSSEKEADLEWVGWQALTDNKFHEAARWLGMASRTKHAPARAWYNLGIAYSRLGKYDDALDAYQHAAQLPDADSQMQQAALDMSSFIVQMKEWKQMSNMAGSSIIPDASTNR